MTAAAWSPRSAAEIASRLDSQPAVTIRSGHCRGADRPSSVPANDRALSSSL
jgi:hypothetical protein